ncbi:MAG: hypothetical protein GOMPHAMPRED_002093 [Gomphillus americanus]|uniref:Uncharacterized protein n=1 Tax=Gomphillus americanus TaxID=1940652 RepID=A0A8H3FBM2_9LECA|nr:MAG: hypothetical protein GOMPHAMPRED_002093 [Gomphillus americanus]
MAIGYDSELAFITGSRDTITKIIIARTVAAISLFATSTATIQLGPTIRQPTITVAATTTVIKSTIVVLLSTTLTTITTSTVVSIEPRPSETYVSRNDTIFDSHNGIESQCDNLGRGVFYPGMSIAFLMLNHPDKVRIALIPPAWFVVRGIN